MRPTRSGPGFRWYRDAVTEQVRSGQPFAEVEDSIELADVSEDEKAALWLFALAMRDRGARVRATELAAVTD